MTKKRKIEEGEEPSPSRRVSEEDRVDVKEGKARPPGETETAERERGVLEGEGASEREIVDTASETASVEEIEKEIEQERNLAQEYLEHLQRLQAEFSNYRKRSQKEILEAYDYAKAELICRLLPVVDDLERAMESLDSDCDSKEALKGVKLVYGKLKSALQAEGLEAIECKGKGFDPNYHEAVVVTKSGEGVDGQVIRDFQKGYTFKGRLVRPSKVEVRQVQSDQGDE